MVGTLSPTLCLLWFTTPENSVQRMLSGSPEAEQRWLFAGPGRGSASEQNWERGRFQGCAGPSGDKGNVAGFLISTIALFPYGVLEGVGK